MEKIIQGVLDKEVFRAFTVPDDSDKVQFLLHAYGEMLHRHFR